MLRADTIRLAALAAQVEANDRELVTLVVSLAGEVARLRLLFEAFYGVPLPRPTEHSLAPARPWRGFQS